MFPIHYLNPHGSVISEETSEATSIADAIAGARRRISEHKGASSFVVFDATGKEIHRESRSSNA